MNSKEGDSVLRGLFGLVRIYYSIRIRIRSHEKPVLNGLGIFGVVSREVPILYPDS